MTDTEYEDIRTILAKHKHLSNGYTGSMADRYRLGIDDAMKAIDEVRGKPRYGNRSLSDQRYVSEYDELIEGMRILLEKEEWHRESDGQELSSIEEQIKFGILMMQEKAYLDGVRTAMSVVHSFRCRKPSLS